MILHVSVETVNDQPVFQEYGEQGVDQNEEVSFQLVAEDPDLDLPSPLTDVLTFTGVGPEIFIPNSDGLVEFQPGQLDVGTFEVTYTVTDSGGLKDVVTITWVIVDVNDDPVITTNPPASVTEDEPFQHPMEATDIDGDDIVWSDDTTLFDIDPSTGLINFTPIQADVGDHHVTITASDGKGGEHWTTFTLQVVNVNDDPAIGTVLPSSGSVYDEGDEIEFEASATDEDGDHLTYVWKRDGKEMGTGPTLTVDDLPSGKHRIILEVTDGNGGLTTFDLEVEVQSSVFVSLWLSIAIAAILAVIVVAFLLARSRGKVDETSVEETPEKESEEEAAHTRREDVVLDYDTECVTVVDTVPVVEAPMDFGDGPLEDVTEVPPEPEEAPLYNLEEAEEYRPEDRKEDEGYLPGDGEDVDPDN
jgi:hypothetical protein